MVDVVDTILNWLPAGWSLGVRLHPVRSVGKLVCRNDRRLIDLSGEIFRSTESVLRETDVLMTDFSSIWVDFLVTGREIVGFGNEVQKVIDSGRLRAEYCSQFPGRWFSSIKKLCETLNTIHEGQPFQKQRKGLLEIVGPYESASIRIVDIVQREMERDL